MLDTPIAFIVYRRPEATQRVFQRIREARPSKLYLIGDGPKPGEEATCKKVRQIVDQVDWPCEVFKNFAEKNMGLRKRVQSGLQWVFDQVDRAIILEDDVLPTPSFFTYCSELLEKYENNPKVVHISGHVHLENQSDYSYSFVKFGSIWGWATWKRVWETYDADMESIEDPNSIEWMRSFVNNDRMFFGKLLPNWREAKRIREDTWDRAWTLTRLMAHGYTIVPGTSLVENIGFGDDATHTKIVEPQPVENMTFPMKHPPQVIPDKKYDTLFLERNAPAHLLPIDKRLMGLIRRLPSRLSRFINRLFRTNQ